MATLEGDQAPTRSEAQAAPGWDIQGIHGRPPGRYERIGDVVVGANPAAAQDTARMIGTQFAGPTDQLRQQINDIYAQNGYPFSIPKEQAHYQQQQGYRPNPNFAGLPESAQQRVDALNAQRDQVLTQYRQFRGAHPIAKTDASEVLRGSDRDVIRPEQLQGMPASLLELARNEIYARHGHQFKDVQLAEFFGRKAWYRPSQQETPLSAAEKQNVQTLIAAERRALGVTR